MRSRELLLLLCLGSISLLGGSIALGDPQSDGQIDELRAKIRQKLQEIDANQQALQGQLEQAAREREELETLLHQVGNLGQYRAGAAPDNGGDAGPPPVVGADQQQQKESQQQEPPALPRVSPDIGGVLTPRGRLVIEPSLEYTHSSSTRVAIDGFTILPALNVGVFDISQANHDAFTVNLAARYGITNKIEAEVDVPYVDRSDSEISRPIGGGSSADTTQEGHGHDLGDISFTARYQLPRFDASWPFMIGNLAVKTATGTDPYALATQTGPTGQSLPTAFSSQPTGTGFWSVNPSITFIYPSDPVVFFGNGGYLINFGGDKGREFGNVHPGDAIRLNVGMGFGLNDRSAFSISYALDLYEPTTIDALLPAGAKRPEAPQSIAGSDATVGRLILGYSLKLASGQPLNLAISIGATKDAPDSDITFRMPFNIDILR